MRPSGSFPTARSSENGHSSVPTVLLSARPSTNKPSGGGPISTAPRGPYSHRPTPSRLQTTGSTPQPVLRAPVSTSQPSTAIIKSSAGPIIPYASSGLIPSVPSSVSTNLSADDAISVVKRQQQQLQELKTKKLALENHIASLRSLMERQQTQNSMSASRLREEHIQITRQVTAMQVIQAELLQVKQNNAQLANELSLSRSEVSRKRTDLLSGQVRRVEDLVSRHDQLMQYLQQIREGNITPLQLQNLLKVASILVSEGGSIGATVWSSVVAQLERLLRERQTLEVRWRQTRAATPSTGDSERRDNGSPKINYISRTPQQQSRNMSNSYTSQPKFTSFPATTPHAVPPVPERKSLTANRLSNQDLTRFNTPTSSTDFGSAGHPQTHGPHSPIAADLSRQELLIHPARPRANVMLNVPKITMKPAHNASIGPAPSFASTPDLTTSNFTASNQSNGSPSLSAKSAPLSSGDSRATDGSSAAQQLNTPPIAPRVMRRVSLLRYASNSTIRDTYFRGSRREELAKKYKPSAEALLQDRLSQLSLTGPNSATSALTTSTSKAPPDESDDGILFQYADPPADFFSVDTNAEDTGVVNQWEEEEKSKWDSRCEQGENEESGQSPSPLPSPKEALPPPPEVSPLTVEIPKPIATGSPVTTPIAGGNVSRSTENSPLTVGGGGGNGGVTTFVKSNQSSPSLSSGPNSATLTVANNTMNSAIVSLPSRLRTGVVAAKCILRPAGVPGSGRRIRFSPLTLLLDASLVGDLDMVKREAAALGNVSEPNDDGITALHNSVCACYDEISRYLVQECGANVNAQELDGWTPLHCAAAIGSVEMCRLLVEHGASLLLPTLEDGETALEKAANLARENAGFGGDSHAACEEYLYHETSLLWRPESTPTLYALFDYTPENPEELALSRNQQLNIVNANLTEETYWFMARCVKTQREGLVPKYFVARYPLVLKGSIGTANVGSTLVSSTQQVPLVPVAQ